MAVVDWQCTCCYGFISDPSNFNKTYDMSVTPRHLYQWTVDLFRTKECSVRKLWSTIPQRLNHGCIYIFFWIPYWPRMLINILWHPLAANQYGGRIWRTGSIFSSSKGLWDCLPSKPITTKHQSVFWLVSQSRRMSAICVGICRWISLAAATADPVVCRLATA